MKKIFNDLWWGIGKGIDVATVIGMYLLLIIGILWLLIEGMPKPITCMDYLTMACVLKLFFVSDD